MVGDRTDSGSVDPMAADGTTLIAANRRAKRNYDLTETLEAGIVLAGSEVKSMREAQVQIADGFVRFDDDEAWLLGVHVAPYLHAQEHTGHDPDRRRKLLLHRREIDRLDSRVNEKGFTLVPLTVYFRRGRAKVELALARGKRSHDKRDTIKQREGDREARRAMRRHTR